MKKFILISVFLSIFVNLYALESVDISKSNKEISILEHSDVYFDSYKLRLKEIVDSNLFKENRKHRINNAQTKRVVWVRFELSNSSNKSVQKALVLDSPSLEYVSLYEEPNSMPKNTGVMVDAKHSTINYYYKITLPPHSKKRLYLRVYSVYKSFFFSLYVEDYHMFRDKDVYKQAPRLILLGLLAGFMFYSLMIAYYSEDKSYFYYGMYLFFLLWHQITFLGLIQIYFPHWFVMFDLSFTIPKLGFILIFAILFATSFLKIPYDSWLMRIYALFGLIGLLIIFVIRDLPLVLIIGVFFVFFNFAAGVVSYRRGVKQARLFILGFGIVSVAYIIVILDSFGITAFLSLVPNILMWATAFEVFILTLAFADRYQILQEEKESILKSREETIQKEVTRKTHALNKALKEKELLLREVHHRVKNNLQIILSIIRLQSLKAACDDTQEMFRSLESRINAISKTYDMLILNDLIETVNMQDYTQALLRDIKQSMLGFTNADIKVNVDTNIELPLKKAVYVGIIINELVTNSYKYAFDGDSGEITVKLYKEDGKYRLIISDNGKGFDIDKTGNSLGLKLIKMLIVQQLEGSIKIETKPSAKYIIEFLESVVLK